MYLNRNKNGYGWYSQVRTKEGESEIIGYLNFGFKKGCEPLPTECTEYGSYSGELIFRDSTGAERKVFPVVKEWNGVKHIELKLLEKGNEYHDPQPTYRPVTEPKWDLGGTQTTYTNEITEDDLPFDENQIRWK